MNLKFNDTELTIDFLSVSGIMKFTALCLFVILGAAVGKPVDTEQSVKAKEPVPLIVSDYSSVVKEDSSSTSAVVAAAVVPAEKSVEEIVAAPADAPVAALAAAPEAPATDAPATDAPLSDEESLVKEFNEEVKQEEKLLTPEASNIDEVRKEQDEEVAVTTEADADTKKSEAAVVGKSVVAVAADDAVKTEEEEVAETTTEPAAAADSVARVVREAEEIATSTDEPKSEESEAKSEIATSTDEPKEARESDDAAAAEVTTTRNEWVVQQHSAPARSKPSDK